MTPRGIVREAALSYALELATTIHEERDASADEKVRTLLVLIGENFGVDVVQKPKRGKGNSK